VAHILADIGKATNDPQAYRFFRLRRAATHQGGTYQQAGKKCGNAALLGGSFMHQSGMTRYCV
jgi:hypothetical protein